jgi:flagellar protein FlaG
MNIQPGKAPLPAVVSAAARANPQPGAGGDKDAASAPDPKAMQAVARQTPLNIEAAKQVAREINDFLKSSSSNLEFSVDGDSSKIVVRVVDAQTNELIRQIPSEVMLVISKAMDQMSGMLIQQKA